MLVQEEKLLHIQRSRIDITQSEIDLRNGTLVAELKALEQKQSAAVLALKKSISSQRAQNEESLASRSEDIVKERSHVDLDLKIVVEREAKVQAAIDEQTVQLRESRNSLKGNLDVVQREIADLLEKLRLKRLEESEFLQELGVVDEQIESVTSKFTKELQRVSENKRRANDRVSKLEAEQRELDSERQQFEASLSTLVVAQQKEEALLSKIRSDLSASHAAVAKADAVKLAASRVLCGLEDGLADSLGWEASVAKQRESIALIAEEIKQSSDKTAQASKAIQAAKQRALVLKTEIIPELEASKKAAAVAKNFKEAATLQKSVKENQTEVEELEKKVETLQAESQQESQLLQKRETELVSLRSTLGEKEKDHGTSFLRTRSCSCSKLMNLLDLKRLRSLSSRIVDLRVVLRKASRSEDYDVAYVTTAELDALRAEVRQIETKHQIDPAPEPELPPEQAEPEPRQEIPPAVATEDDGVTTEPVEGIEPVSGAEQQPVPPSAEVDITAETQKEEEGSMFDFISEADPVDPTDDPESVPATENQADLDSSMFSGMATDEAETSSIVVSNADEPVFPGISDDGPSSTSASDPEPQPDLKALRRAELEEYLVDLRKQKADLDAKLDLVVSNEDYDAACTPLLFLLFTRLLIMSPR